MENCKECKNKNKEIRALNQDKIDYEKYHAQLSKKVSYLLGFIMRHFKPISVKEAFEKNERKKRFIETDLISYDRKNRTAFINYARDFEYEDEIKKELTELKQNNKQS